MLKQILGAVVGYIATFICMFIAFTCFYLAMGADNAFTPGSYQVSILWIILSLFVIFICGAIGGFVASRIGGRSAAKMMAGIILVLNVMIMVYVAVTGFPDEARAADVPNMVAMSKAQTPLWALVIQMIVSITGALVGGGLRKNKFT
jgi:ascorbate-specific PTS system EIIC-type component UlaA